MNLKASDIKCVDNQKIWSILHSLLYIYDDAFLNSSKDFIS
jgi:hypothetical protein